MKIKNFLPILIIIYCFALFQSCDKIKQPYIDGIATPPSSAGDFTSEIVLQNIKGGVTDFKITDNWLSDSSALNATWTVNTTASGTDGSITFTWHDVSTTLNATSVSGFVTITGPVSISAGGFFGTLSFTYSGTFASGGTGEGYVTAYVDNSQNILIEDYTGHQCGNCPEAAITISSLKEIYKERLLSIAVHAGPFADTLNHLAGMYTYDFRTPVGNDLDAHFGISNAGNPNGMVNRIKYNGNIIATYPSWGSHVADIIAANNFPKGGIKIENTYTASDSTLKIKVKTCFFNNLSSSYKLCVYLLEDSIQKWQKKYPPLTPLNDPNYWHRDVLRGSANGTWGDVLSPSTKGIIIEKNYSMTIKNEYRAVYCKVLVFIYDEVTEEIMQVKEAPIIQ